MKTLGLDIGTTTISVVVAEDGKVLSSITLKNDSFLPTPHSWERIQDPFYIRSTALQAVEQLLHVHTDVQHIGVTGQMHGIVYLDTQGNPVSPLYTWQDGRGDLQYNAEESYAARLGRITGYSVATGYGLVTHYYNLKNGLVPPSAVVFCTIHDYIAMILAGGNSPVTEASDGASLGVFDVEQGTFDVAALKKADMDTSMLPKLAVEQRIGLYQEKIPVYAAIGDNQASFLGATGGNLNSMLVNVGTGSQFSAYTQQYMACPGLETRPFPGGGYLIVGASLCGGRAYALLESFFRGVVEIVTGSPVESCYDSMDKLLNAAEKPSNLPVVTPLFQGTRQDPTLQGSVTALTTENFSPKHFAWAMLEGMAKELYDMYQMYLTSGGKIAALIGSGNGLRKNSHLKACFEELFGVPLKMSECNEEAATGAAIYADMQ